MENVWIFAVVNSLVGNLACLQSETLTHGNTRTKKVFNCDFVNWIHPMREILMVCKFIITDLNFCEIYNKSYFLCYPAMFSVSLKSSILELVELWSWWNWSTQYMWERQSGEIVNEPHSPIQPPTNHIFTSSVQKRAISSKINQ